MSPSLMLPKTHCVEVLMHFKSVLAQSPPVVMVWEFGEKGANSSPILSLTVIQNYGVSSNSLCAALQAREKRPVWLFSENKDNFWDRIVTCDEKWVYYNNTSHEGGYLVPGESAACNCDPPGLRHIGNCSYVDNTKQCECPSGYKFSTRFQECEDINECLIGSVCPSTTNCVNVPGSFQCECKKGYELANDWDNPKEVGCKDINECSIGGTCATETTRCINTPGSYDCVCREGYYATAAVQGDTYMPMYNVCYGKKTQWEGASIAIAWLVCYEFEPSTANPPRRCGRWMLNLSRISLPVKAVCFTSICASAFPIAIPASVPPALFRFLSTPPSLGANITTCNKTLPSQQYSCGSPLVLLYGENTSQAEIVNGVNGADSVTANYVQFWFRRFRSGIFDVKAAP
ncbi:fibulin-1 [Trichonephila clavipes]|nr:fibulin-1 [Trichonephila clavipes]